MGNENFGRINAAARALSGRTFADSIPGVGAARQALRTAAAAGLTAAAVTAAMPEIVRPFQPPPAAPIDVEVSIKFDVTIGGRKQRVWNGSLARVTSRVVKR